MRNILIISLINITIIVSFILLLGIQFERSSTELRKDELKRLVSLGLNSIEVYRTQYENGYISREEALNHITDRVRMLTYEDKKQPNYLFMSSYDGTMLVQPYQRSLEGSNQIDLIDSDGRYIIRELISQAKTEPGYVSYNYYPPGSDIAFLKISYVVGLPEFECYIGTGIYSSDLSLIRKTYLDQSILFLIVSVIIILTSAAVVLTPIILAVQYIASCFLKIQENPDLENLQIETPNFIENSDADIIVRRFNETIRSLSEKNRTLIETAEERDRIKEENLKILGSSLTEKELLIKEMNHRVKNNLQIVISLLSLQKEKSDSRELKDSYGDSISRMESISLIHQMLYQGDNLSSISGKIYLEQLVRYLIHSFGMDDRINLDIDIDEVNFSIEQAVSIGLLTNEIITNSVKYAAPDNPDCKISVGLLVNGENTSLVLSDNGPGIPDKILQETTQGLGLNLIRSLAAQLGGKLRIENRSGTSYFLTF